MGLFALQHVESPGAGIQPMSPALAGGFFTPEPPGKPLPVFFCAVYLGSGGKD